MDAGIGRLAGDEDKVRLVEVFWMLAHPMGVGAVDTGRPEAAGALAHGMPVD